MPFSWISLYNDVTAACRRVLLDLAVRSGATLRSAAIGDLGADAVAASFEEIHSFQVWPPPPHADRRWPRDHVGDGRMLYDSVCCGLCGHVRGNATGQSPRAESCKAPDLIYVRSRSVRDMPALARRRRRCLRRHSSGCAAW